MTAEEIHQLGLREIDRIEAEMTAIAKKEGFRRPGVVPRIAQEQSQVYSHFR